MTGEERVSDIEFLNGDGDHEKIVISSYPRSGNTLTRSYLEQLTRIYTGSDCQIHRTLNKQLQSAGLCGESEIDNKVWIVKTHYPKRTGSQKFIANRAIVVVRSPLDCIASLFNMIGTLSHSESLSESVL